MNLVDRLEELRQRILDSGELEGDEFLELRVDVDRDLREIALGVARLSDGI